MQRSSWLGGLFFASAWLVAPAGALASTGVCDSNPPVTTQACINAIQTGGAVVNDIFKDTNGKTASQLALFGKLVDVTKVFPGCASQAANCAGCNPGTSNAPYDCPGQYTCAGGACTVTSVGAAVNALDRKWGHPWRLTDHTLTANCPNYASGIADGVGGNYIPWEGLVFDLGGPSNQVAIFAENDHGPQPCESAEYTIYLTDNPASRDIILNPTTSGADPNKWNRAVLKKIFTEGFVKVRSQITNPMPACGDTANYSVEEDSMVTVYAMPCGINFRYAAVVAGNDGRDFPACAYDSQEAELDAVAGLTESGAGVCPDVDGDTYVACTCATAPAVCDCDDNDANTHPNAPEACDAPKDFNCNAVNPEPCPPGLACNAGLCIPQCGSAEFPCPTGSTCSVVDSGQKLCVPTDCTVGGCPPGSTCDPTSKKCVPNCNANVVCPLGQKCLGGECVDPCRDIKCAAGFACKDGVCNPPCSCFAGDVGCAGTDKCDRPVDGGAGSNQCISPDCLGVACTGGKICKPGIGCADYCGGVKCPSGEVCLAPAAADAGADASADSGAARYGCVNLCAGVKCAVPAKCDSTTGTCTGGLTGDGGLVAEDSGAVDEPDAGVDGGPSDFENSGSGEDGGCACRAAGASGGSALALLVGLGIVTAFAARRRNGKR